jgi:ubiquinone/menaquinone biosynthesis C-methylase UbiE
MVWLVIVALVLIVLIPLFVLVTDGRYFGKPLIRWIYDRFGPFLFGSRSEAARWRDLAQRLDLRGDEAILDVGTAVGDLPLTLAGLPGFRGHAWGVDWSPRMMAAAQAEAQQRTLGDRVTFQVVDVRESLPFEMGQFDVVCCIGLLETWSQPEQILAELGRVLKPDGALVLSLYRGWSSWGAHLSRDWYTRHCAALGYDHLHVIPSRRSQELVIARRAQSNHTIHINPSF